MELTIQIRGNDNCYLVEYDPGTGIEEVFFNEGVFDTQYISVPVGDFPNVKIVPIIDELNRLAEIEFVDRRADYEDMKRDEALEHRMEGME